MSKELPYFRVTVQEWQNGDISDEKDATQGIFMQVCCFYWAHNCDVTLERLEKRFRNKKKHIENLINSSIIKQKDGKIHINFLDFQLENIQKEKKFYSDMGKKGYKAKKSQAPLKTNSKPPLSNKDKDKDKDKDKENIYKPMFEHFWQVYPKRNGKKVGKQTAKELFFKIPKEQLSKVVANAKNHGINNNYPVDPPRFLRKNYWQDWDTPQTEGRTNGQFSILERAKSEERAKQEENNSHTA